MQKSTATLSSLSKIIQELLTKIKNQKSFHDNVKKNINIFNEKQVNKLSLDEKKQLFDIFNDNPKDSSQLEKIATWLIEKMGGKFEFNHHYKFDQTFITVKKLTRNFFYILKKTKKDLISQQYEYLCNSEDLTKDNAYHYLILTGLSLYFFENKDLIIKEEQNRLNKENKFLATINEEPEPELEIEQSLCLDFSDPEWEEIEFGYANHLKSSLAENEESEKAESKTKQPLDEPESAEDSTDLASDYIGSAFEHNINSDPNSGFNQHTNLTWINQSIFKANNSALTFLELYNFENEELEDEELETKQSIDDSEFVEDPTDLKWDHIEFTLMGSPKTPTSQNKISSDSKQENKSVFFPLSPIAKNEVHHSESLQNGIEQATMKTIA